MTTPSRPSHAVDTQVSRRGLSGKALIEALGAVDRADFLPAELAEQAWEDVTHLVPGLPAMPRLFVLAAWLDQLDLAPGQRVLVAGADSGYVLAVLARLASEVHAVDADEGHARLEEALVRLEGLGNVTVHEGDPTQGWPEAAPYDRILMLAPARELPEALGAQLAPGGIALLPVGPDWSHLFVERVIKGADGTLETRHVTMRDIVPQPAHLPRIEESRTPEQEAADILRDEALPFDDIDSFDMDALLERIGEARVVLMGEASHGTSEFYRMRAAITRALIEKKGFNIVSFEADWPDMERVNDWVLGREGGPATVPFKRFPRWMWRNGEFLDLVTWLRGHNARARAEGGREAELYGLDVYGLENATVHLVDYLDKVDPELAREARARLACISPYLEDPATYGRLVLTGALGSCEAEVTGLVMKLLSEQERLDHRPAYFHAVRNATAVADAERYYKVMYYGGADSWNLRDMHMFQTLRSLLSFHGPDSKAIVWAHNSHVGNAVATEMYSRGEVNIGHLSREAFGERAYVIGFGTHTGTVAAADDWGGPMKIKDVRPSMAGSYERLCHATGLGSFALPLRTGLARERLVSVMSEPRLERAIGVIYRPETERQSHYFNAAMASQFDELIWFDRSEAVNALDAPQEGVPPRALPHPFAAMDE